MSGSCKMISGRSYEFEYPKHNFTNIASTHETRRVRVKTIRDMWREPLEPGWFKLNPTLRRSRWLVICEDLDMGEERQFYSKSMINVREIVAPQAKRFTVLDFQRVRFEAADVSSAIAYRQGRASGEVYMRMTGATESVAPVLPRSVN